MLESTAALGQAFLSGIWNLFDVPVPGFDFTFRQFWLAVALCGLSIWVIHQFFGSGQAPPATPKSQKNGGTMNFEKASLPVSGAPAGILPVCSRSGR